MLHRYHFELASVEFRCFSAAATEFSDSSRGGDGVRACARPPAGGAMSVKSLGARSSGRRAPQQSSNKDVQAMMQCGLDFQGSDDMPECKLYTLRGGQTIERKPDGSKCLTCFLRDDMWCCVQIAIHQKKAYIAWGQVDATTGESSSTRCYCCLEHFNSVVCYSRVPSITLSEYETQLGLDGKALELHQARIVALLHDAVDKGTFNHAVTWQVNEKRAVVLQHKQAMIIKQAWLSVSADVVLY